MASEIRTERLFWAAMGDSDVSQTFGPFGTAEEAETHSRRLGWGYCAVWTRRVDEFNTVLDLKKRYWELSDIGAAGTTAQDLSDVDALRNKLVAAREFVPLTEDEEKFFAGYEEQMATPTTYACAECGEDIAPDDLHEVPQEHRDGTKETLRFHKSLTRCCPLKWANKRLMIAADKLTKIAQIYDEIRKEVRNGR